MPLKVPLYLIVGNQPVSLERIDGSVTLRGWDFGQRKLTIEAASWDDVVDLQPGIPVLDSFEISEGETVEVTKAEFNRAIRELKRT